MLIFWELSFNTRIILLYLRYLRSLQQKSSDRGVSTEDCGGSGKRNCSVYGRKVRVLIFWELSFNTRIILIYLRYLRSLQQK